MDKVTQVQVLKDLYEKNKKNNGNQIIPKIFHQVWLGSSYPAKYESLKESFIKHNPDWDLRVWTDDDVEKFDFITGDKIYKAKNYGTKSDIFRLEILYKFGGVYIDTDFLCTKSFNDLVHLDFFAGGLDEDEIFNGLMGSKKENPFIFKMLTEMREIDFDQKDLNKIMATTGPYYLTEMFFKYLDLNQNAVSFPSGYFYPFPAINRLDIRDKHNQKECIDYLNTFIKPETHTIHLWNCSWQK